MNKRISNKILFAYRKKNNLRGYTDEQYRRAVAHMQRRFGNIRREIKKEEKLNV